MANVKTSFKQYGIMTIPCRYIYECLVYCRRNYEVYNLNSNFHRYPTSQVNQIRLDHYRLERSRISSNYYGPRFFNVLPESVRLLPLNQFSNTIKKISPTKPTFTKFVNTSEFTLWCIFLYLPVLLLSIFIWEKLFWG